MQRNAGGAQPVGQVQPFGTGLVNVNRRGGLVHRTRYWVAEADARVQLHHCAGGILVLTIGAHVVLVVAGGA